MKLALKAQLGLEEKESEVLKLLSSIDDIKKSHQRSLDEKNAEIQRWKDKSDIYHKKIQELQSDIHQRQNEPAKLEFQMQESHYNDVDMEDRITREQFVIESQYQQEMRRQAKDFETQNHELLRENKSLLTEIKLLKGRMLQLETNKIHSGIDKDVFSERVQELKLENHELHQIVQQMRVDMENMAMNTSMPEVSLANVHAQVSNTDVSVLRSKLELALAELQMLAKEKAQLVEMSNSLRASIRKPETLSTAVQATFAGAFPALTKLSRETRVPLIETVKLNEKQKLKMKVSTDQFRKSLSKSKSIRNYNDRE